MLTKTLRLAVTSLAFSLVACGGSSSEPSSEGGNSLNQQSEAQQSSDQPSAAQESSELDVLPVQEPPVKELPAQEPPEQKEPPAQEPPEQEPPEQEEPPAQEPPVQEPPEQGPSEQEEPPTPEPPVQGPPEQEPSEQEEPPVQEPPVQDPPEQEPSEQEEPPTQEPPAQEPPEQEPSEQEEPPVQEPPVQDPPEQEPSEQEEPPVQEPPVQDPPEQEPPAQEPPVQGPPEQDDPPVDTTPNPVNLGSGGFSDYEDVGGSQGFAYFQDQVQPLLANECSDCHMGQRFAFTSLSHTGATFSHQDSVKNYHAFADLLSLDKPELSRLLAKILPKAEGGIDHHGGAQVADKNDELYQTVLAWAELEKSQRCPDCGTTADAAYVAYVAQPNVFWMIERNPVRIDRGTRQGAKIMLQPVDPKNGSPLGTPIDFLAGAANGFCADGDCDFGHMSANHSGDTLVFECRIPVVGEPWLERSWNICMAEIDAQGRAVNPRFLVPEAHRHHGILSSRVDPLGISAATASQDPYDRHFQNRVRNDAHPLFSPDDSRIIFASERADPRSGVDAVQTYHGQFYLNNIISTSLQGTGAQTIYRNEGGTADLPFHLYNGRIAFHTWNLERMDQHMYLQADADGMMEMPVLGGSLQGPNMWGKAFQSNNGLIFGMTGRRRGELESYAPFLFDHTLGIEGINAGAGFKIIPEYDSNNGDSPSNILEEISDYPNGYCRRGTPEENTTRANCHISQLIVDTAYMPDGRALVSHNPEVTYIGEGERFTLNYARGSSASARQQSAEPYLPQRVNISALDQQGNITPLIPNDNTGWMYRYPTWVGKRQHPRIQQLENNGDTLGSNLHIADFSLWLLFGYNLDQNKSNLMSTLDRISSVRVLRKINENGACLQDHKYITATNFESNGYHPTALGYIDATGYEQYHVPAHLGGDGYGDVPLQSDKSVKLRVPAGELLLLQGVDSEGRVIAQRERLFSLPAGRDIDTSVKRDQYTAQCAACHGTIHGSLANAQNTAIQPAVLSFDTDSQHTTAVDLLANSVQRRELTFLEQLRPLFDAKCVSCHNADKHEGDLSLQAAYSATANYMPASWESSIEPSLISHMAGKTKIRAYNASVPYSYYVGDKQQSNYSQEINSGKPLGELAPWDSGYQNLFRDSSNEIGKSAINFYYLSGTSRSTNYGRARSTPSNSSRGYLLEVLTGNSTLDPNKDYSGYDHTHLLTETELRTLMAVMDVGMPYMARCDDQTVPSGPNAGLPWGDAF